MMHLLYSTHLYSHTHCSLAICLYRSSDRTVSSSVVGIVVVVVVVDVCNHCQTRTTKYTSLIFDVSTGFDPS